MSIQSPSVYDTGMTGKRLLIHMIFLFLLPLIVAWFGVSVGGAVALVVFALATRNDIERWIEKYPYATGFINRLYEQERTR